MSDDQNRIELIRMVLGKDVKPSTVYPACWHNPRRNMDVGQSEHAEHLDVGLIRHAKARHSLLGRLMGRLNRWLG